MRINFAGSFNQVVRLLEAKAEPQAGSASLGEFAETLAQVTAQPPEKPRNLPVSRESIPTASPDLMASLNFERPGVKSPPLTPFSGEILLPDAVKETASGVKTPSGLTAKRVHIRDGAGYHERMKQVEPIVTQVGKATGIDPALGMAVAKAESSFNPRAVSSDGHESKGLFQLLDSTGRELHEESGAELGYDPFDPSLNVNLGVRYLRRLHDIFSQNTKLPNDLESTAAANSSSLEKLAVAAFNAGEGRVAAAQGRAKAQGLNAGIYEQVETYLPKTTQEYVSRVMRFKGQFGPDTIG
ncbi:MAG: hypothetical protein EBZ48_00445 [Proteobacteria bacterium]|nr:hypothetical protein [Pseudomonadota bacterium]